MWSIKINLILSIKRMGFKRCMSKFIFNTLEINEQFFLMTYYFVTLIFVSFLFSKTMPYFSGFTQWQYSSFIDATHFTNKTNFNTPSWKLCNPSDPKCWCPGLALRPKNMQYYLDLLFMTYGPSIQLTWDSITLCCHQWIFFA